MNYLIVDSFNNSLFAQSSLHLLLFFFFLFQCGVFETQDKIIIECESVHYSMEFYAKSYKKEQDL